MDINIDVIQQAKDQEIPGLKESEKQGFRIFSRRLFLTYSRCPEHWTKEFVKEKLVNEILINKYGDKKGKSKVRAYVIAEEKHKEPVGRGEYERGDKHYHCLLEASEKFQITDERYLDIEGIHGNYQAVENVWAVLNYVKKECDWISKDFLGIESRERNILEASTELEAKLMLMNKMKPNEQLRLREEYRKLNRDENKASIEMETTKIRIEVPFAFKRDLEPYIQQLIGKGIGGFNLEGRPVGILLYGKSGVGKSSWRKDLERILKEKARCVNRLRSIADRYNEETIIVLDEFTGLDFKNHSKELKLMITEDQCETLPYKKVVDLAWPRRVLICTNENIEKWYWEEGMRERFLMIEIKGSEDYQCKLWRKNVFETWVLEDKSLEETMEYLGFEVKEIKEMKLEELDSLDSAKIEK